MSASLKIFENHSLKALNTLGLEARARYFVEVDSVEVLWEALAFSRARHLPLVPLGGGSNVVLCGTLKAVVARIHLQGRTLLPEAGEEGSIRVRAEAGENWHDFVLWTLAQGAYGLENLSLIPGLAGAAPIQN
ncbi:MAG: FAD-binding protein, partial [Endozoicomonas sp.]